MFLYNNKNKNRWRRKHIIEVWLYVFFCGDGHTKKSSRNTTEKNYGHLLWTLIDHPAVPLLRLILIFIQLWSRAVPDSLRQSARFIPLPGEIAKGEAVTTLTPISVGLRSLDENTYKVTAPLSASGGWIVQATSGSSLLVWAREVSLVKSQLTEKESAEK